MDAQLIKLLEPVTDPGNWEALGRNIRVIIMERNRFRRRLERAEKLLREKCNDIEVEQFLNEKFDW